MSNYLYRPRIYEPIDLVGPTPDSPVGLKHTATAAVTTTFKTGDRYSYALLSQIQTKVIDYIYNQLHDICVGRKVTIHDGMPNSAATPNTFMFGDAALVHPLLKYRPILASDRRPLFNNSILLIEYIGRRLGTLTYSEDKQITTTAINNITTESIDFYLALQLVKIKNITIFKSQ